MNKIILIISAVLLVAGVFVTLPLFAENNSHQKESIIEELFSKPAERQPVQTQSGIAVNSPAAREDFVLFQNYPNPFNPETNIVFDLQKGGQVALSVYDIVGHRVDVLLNRKMSPGVHVVHFDGQNLPSGVYFYRMKVGKYMQVRKMDLLG